jgi:hypothetical protein
VQIEEVNGNRDRVEFENEIDALFSTASVDHNSYLHFKCLHYKAGIIFFHFKKKLRACKSAYAGQPPQSKIPPHRQRNERSSVILLSVVGSLTRGISPTCQ